MKKTNFFEYLGIEESNLLISFQRTGELFGLFGMLEDIYLQVHDRLNLNKSDEQTIALLYLFVEFHLYFSVSCVMRCHLSEAFASTRKAIDAALTAYRIIDDPSTASDYAKRDRKFVKIQTTIRREREKNSKKFPLAGPLLDIHDLFSKYGAHVDINSFFNRYEIKQDEDGKGNQMFFGYFQHSKSDKEFKYWFVYTLLIYHYIFKIFKEWFSVKFKVYDQKWEYSIETLGVDLLKLAKRYQI